MTKIELAEMLERFIGDAPDCGEWEWDDFISVKASPDLEPFRQRLLKQGVDPLDTDELRQIITELKN